MSVQCIPHFGNRYVYRAACDHPLAWVMWDDINSAEPEKIMALAMAYNTALAGAGDLSVRERYEKLRASLRDLYNGCEPSPGDYLADSGLIRRLGKNTADFVWVVETMSVKLAELAVVTKTNRDEIATIITSLNDTLIGATSDPQFFDGELYKDACHCIHIAQETVAEFYEDWEHILDSFYHILADPRFAHLYIENITPITGGNVNGIPTANPFPPPEITDPHTLRQAWNQLSAIERNAILYEHPERLGNLAGIPSIVRDLANRMILNRDLNEARLYFRQHGITETDVLAHKDEYKNDPLMCHYINAIMIQRGLENQENALTKAGIDKPVLLIKYDPYALGYRGAAITSIGDPDTARNIAVLVPGTGNSVFNGYLSNKDIINAAHECTAANQDTAIVACMDYQSPDSPNDMNMYSPQLARQGGLRIKEDVNNLWITHHGDPPHITVIGHSYGATTVADACVAGMHTNDVVLLGCPGMDQAHHAMDLHLDRGHLYVGANSKDGISYAGGHLPSGIGVGLGDDPSGSNCGSIRFAAESLNSQDFDHHGHINNVHDLFREHSKYFDKGSESLYNIADITSGNSTHLFSDGMLAHHRAADTIFHEGSLEVIIHLVEATEILKKSTNPLADALDLLGRDAQHEIDQDPEHPRHAINNHYHNLKDKDQSW